MRSVRAELRKLLRPLTMWMVGAAVILSGLVSIAYWEATSASIENVRRLHDYAQAGIPCQDLGIEPGVPCGRAQSREVRWADESLLDLQSDGAIAATSGSFIGAGGFAARMLASVIGMLVLCTVAAAHVGGEFGGGTIRGVFLQDPRRWRVMLAKAISLLIFAVFLWAVLWASTVVVGMVAHRVLSLPAALPAADQWEYMVSGFARGMLPMATFIALGMMFGAITRSALAGAAAAIGVLFMGLITSALGIRAWSIGAWIADLMQFQQRIVFVDFVWTKAGYPSLTTGFAASGLLLTVLIGIATTLWRVQRIDID